MVDKFLVRSTSDTSQIDNSGLNAQKYYGDVDSIDDIKDCVSGGYTTLFHILQGAHLSSALVRCVLEAGVQRIITVHSTSVYSSCEKHNRYLLIENEVGELAKKYDAQLICIRPTMIYGSLNDKNMSVFIKMVDKFRLFPVIAGGRAMTQPVWCADVGRAYYQIMLNKGNKCNGDYIISGKESMQTIEIFREIGRQLGVHNTFISIPYWLSYSGAWLLYILTLKRKDFREKVQRMTEDKVFSHDAAARDFGFDPSPFSVGVRSEIEQYKAAKLSIG